MSAPPDGFYSEERWDNWLGRVRETDVDLEDEDSAQLLMNIQDDAAIAVAKVLTAYDEGDLDEEAALGEVDDVRDVVLSEVDLDSEDAAMLVETVQISLEAVFAAAQEYVAGGPAEEAGVEEYVRAAADAAAGDDPEAAWGYTIQAGTRVVDGDELDIGVVEELEYSRVVEWVDGLDSLQRALADPEVVEEEDAEE